jgi:phage-related protein
VFYFKGISSDTMKVVVSKTPIVSKGQKRIEKINIPGRSGFLTIDNGVYESFVISIECHLDKDDANIDEVLLWLDGVGKLSLDNVRQWEAVITNSINLEKVIGGFRSFLLQFECQPISENITETMSVVTVSPTTLSTSFATAEMPPLLEVTGTGDISITINNKTFNLYDLDGTYYLDSRLKVITNSLGQNISDKMLYDFPVLVPGNNVISYIGTVESLVFKYHRAFL